MPGKDTSHLVGGGFFVFCKSQWVKKRSRKPTSDFSYAVFDMPCIAIDIFGFKTVPLAQFEHIFQRFGNFPAKRGSQSAVGVIQNAFNRQELFQFFQLDGSGRQMRG
ncbi:hypothetical protein [Thermoactinomyces sp. CICC 10522]|uniref:hypothetical protein n=1 Tax=Thermoactinomyces sp. CICC 10522 TaxID=2767427 RepID=UPI0018DDDA95|nr:hypothetical protein [Thermoactinomyces sp. CICC 10522]MBH8602605.1 hypothetical protein [Thermoactinomyces sp. CICC 10522]